MIPTKQTPFIERRGHLSNLGVFFSEITAWRRSPIMVRITLSAIKNAHILYLVRMFMSTLNTCNVSSPIGTWAVTHEEWSTHSMRFAVAANSAHTLKRLVGRRQHNTPHTHTRIAVGIAVGISRSVVRCCLSHARMACALPRARLQNTGNYIM